MTAPKYKLNSGAFRRDLLKADWMVAEMRRRAEKGKELAEQIAPDAEPYGEGYIASFKVKSGKSGGIHGDRAYGMLINNDDAAVYIEFGTEKTEARHIMLGAMIVMGE